MMGGKQIMSLQIDGCVFDSIAAHEAIHALGCYFVIYITAKI